MVWGERMVGQGEAAAAASRAEELCERAVMDLLLPHVSPAAAPCEILVLLLVVLLPHASCCLLLLA